MFHDIIGTTPDPYHVKFTLGAEPWRIRKAILVIRKDGESEMSYPLGWETFDGKDDRFSVTIDYMSVGLYFYHFVVNDVERIGRDASYFCANGGTDFQLTVYEERYRAPEWLEGGLIYQILVDRFCAVDPLKERSGGVYREDWDGTPEYRPVNGKILNNDFFGGNLKGVLSKLDYLADLSVTCIYFNPIFEAASNHKYDTGNYFKIDPGYGTEEDLTKLIEEAKKRGISVILDGVFSHTGDDSIYFNRYGRYDSVGAYQSQSSPYYGWYKFARWPDAYDSWWGIDILPEVEETQPDYLEFVTGERGVVAYWLQKGIAGWRLDVADELPDSFLARLTARVKSVRQDALVLGEVWEDASNKISYSVRRKYFLGKELDSVTNYVFRTAILAYLRTGDACAIARQIQEVIYHYPKRVLNVLMNIVGTHDTPRMLTMLSGKNGSLLTRDQRAQDKLNDEEYDRARRKLFIAAALQYTLPGVPCVFYGDEAGLEGHEDPFNRRTYPWGREDEKILAFYRKLGRMRAAQSVLKQGAYRCLYAYGNVFVYQREAEGRRLYVGVNLGNTPFTAPLNESVFDAFSGEAAEHFTVPPTDFVILVNEE